MIASARLDGASGAEEARREWQGKIQKAATCAEVFELAGLALLARGAWGDDLRGSSAAARKWAGFFFPVEAAEEGARFPDRSVPRSDLLAAGLRAAKDVACELLEPLPPSRSHASWHQEAELDAQWSLMSGRAVRAASDALAGNLVFKGLSGCEIFGYDSMFCSPTIEWAETAKAEAADAWDEARDKLAKPWEKFLRANCSDVVLSETAEQWTCSSDDPGEIAKLLASTGTSFVLAGPAGGMQAIAKGASMLRHNYGELSRLTGLRSEAIGLGLSGIALNMASRDAAGYHDSHLGLMAFAHVPLHLGHEWTHLLDARVRKFGTPEQRAALADVKKAPDALAADPELVAERRAFIFERCRIALGWFMESKGKAKITRARVIPAQGPDGDPRCDDIFFNQACHAVAAGRSSFQKFMERQRDPKAAKLHANETLALFEDLSEALGLDPMANKACDFVREAQIHDAMGYGPKGYFLSQKEMIARIAESSFAAWGAPPSLASQEIGDGTLSPRGGEAKELAKAYRKLLDACVAAPEALAGARRQAQPAPPAKLKPVALSLEAWRALRQEVDGAGELPARPLAR